METWQKGQYVLNREFLSMQALQMTLPQHSSRLSLDGIVFSVFSSHSLS